jgi:hypothetical protein
VNTGPLEEKLQPSTKAKLNTMYQSSNHEVAATLRAQGYERLPVWMDQTI